MTPDDALRWLGVLKKTTGGPARKMRSGGMFMPGTHRQLPGEAAHAPFISISGKVQFRDSVHPFMHGPRRRLFNVLPFEMPP